MLLGAQHTFPLHCLPAFAMDKKAAEPADTCCILSILHHPPQAVRAVWLLAAAGAAQKAINRTDFGASHQLHTHKYTHRHPHTSAHAHTHRKSNRGPRKIKVIYNVPPCSVKFKDRQLPKLWQMAITGSLTTSRLFLC